MTNACVKTHDKVRAELAEALRMASVNLDGGGLAIGHPRGVTGAHFTGKAAALLARRRGRYALSAQCIGGGQGIATVLERP